MYSSATLEQRKVIFSCMSQDVVRLATHKGKCFDLAMIEQDGPEKRESGSNSTECTRVTPHVLGIARGSSVSFVL